MSSAAEVDQVVSELKAWRKKFEAGKLRLWGIRQAKLEGGERLATRIVPSQASVEDISVPMAQWHTVPGPAFSLHQDAGVGMAIATSERAFLFGGRKHGTLGEWRWADLSSVTLLRPAVGVALAAEAGDSRATVLSSRWNSKVAGSKPNPVKLMIRWLEFEAAFEDHRGRLDPWMAELPARVAAGLGGD